ncbi:MAG: HlyD family efflux transporter periplasmic adaptor subunit [Eubacteriales bacterium]|nr:HlyD family efflux transporter periplasmic adaptor subunit [Eubacteriales bacterium]
MEKRRKSPLFIYIAVVLVLFSVLYLFPQVTGFLKPTYIARYGELKTYDDVTGYFVRDEKVYFSNKTGNIENALDEGDLIRKGTCVMDVSGTDEGSGSSSFSQIRDNVKGGQRVDTSDYITKSEGVLSYSADGYESQLTPDNMKSKDRTFYQDIGKGAPVNLKRNTTAGGDPVFKIADRSNWYIVCFVDDSHADRYKEDTDITVKVGSTSIIGNIMYKKADGDSVRLIIKTNYYLKDFAKLRATSVRLITSDSTGILIKNSSIETVKGQKGVYVRTKTGSYKFVPVNILDSDGSTSTVSSTQFTDAKGNLVSTVKVYDVIERNP